MCQMALLGSLDLLMTLAFCEAAFQNLQSYTKKNKPELFHIVPTKGAFSRPLRQGCSNIPYGGRSYGGRGKMIQSQPH